MAKTSRRTKRYARIAMWCLWVLAAYIIAAFIALAVYYCLQYWVLKSNLAVSKVFLIIVMQLVQVVLAFRICIDVPYWFGRHKGKTKAKRRADKMRLMGISRLPNRNDVRMLFVAIVVYHVLIITALGLASLILPHEIIDQEQYVGFTPGNNSWLEVAGIIGLLGLVVPMAEEMIFRGFLFGKIEWFTGFWPAALITSGLFAVVHGQINVGITTFILSMIACYMRRKTKAIWVGIGLHMMVNLTAVTILYVLPLIHV